jgi:lipopolysaccharide biosynthesis glycosyltransferase
VAFCIDKAYMQHLAVSLISLFLHYESSKLQVYVVSPPLEAGEREKLDAICIPFGTKLIYQEIGPSCVSELREHLHLSRAAYYRLFYQYILTYENRIIYLDCDLAIEANLRELWETDIGQVSAQETLIS